MPRRANINRAVSVARQAMGLQNTSSDGFAEKGAIPSLIFPADNETAGSPFNTKPTTPLDLAKRHQVAFRRHGCNLLLVFGISIRVPVSVADLLN